MSNRLFIAAAGSGKTRFLIDEALAQDSPTLILSYTIANTEEIKLRIIKRKGCIPGHITIYTWFSFLLKHGVRPYQNQMVSFRCKGMLFVNQKSGIRARTRNGRPIYYAEADPENHYFSPRKKIYSDKVSKFVVKCDTLTEGKVSSRLESIFSNIYIDEVQDLAGYDLELITILLQSGMAITMVGDLRQVTYLTHVSSKNSQYRNGLIANYIREKCPDNLCEIDEETLNISHRCNQEICDFSSRLYPELPTPTSGQEEETGHDGIFLVPTEKVSEYLETYKPLQLRYDKRTAVDPRFGVRNFGEAKGLTVDRVLIYAPSSLINWLKNHDYDLNEKTRCKYYVALTRAKFSVGIICNEEIEGYNVY
jgi:DNA helicase-2/ATP-dependent DNA helicase PcrA